MTPAEATPATAQLVELARRELHGDSALSDDAGFARLQARMGAPKSSWGWGWATGLGLTVSAAAVAGVLYVRSLSDHITFQVAGDGLAKNGAVIGGADTRIRFSDGSVAHLSRGSEAAVENLTEHGADVVLKRGTMRVQITKKPQAAWKVAAGPYSVQVTGTAFDVSWSTQEQAFDLRMSSGSVIVTGPLAVTGIPLKAGQHMFGGVAEGRLTVEGGEPIAAVAPATEPAPEPAPAAFVPPTVPSAPAPQGTPGAHPWARQVAQGHFAAVIAEAEQRGLARTLSSGSLEELAALADAARYSGRAQIAKRVLLAERQRFPGSSAARDAAFFLGRIAEDSGGGAIEWYERYVSESPRGSYASQAFGRKMMLVYKQRGASAAKPVAADYLSRYPNGPYAAAARKIDEESSRATKP